MATKLRIEFDSEGFKKLLNSPEIKEELERRAKAIASAAGPGFEVEEFVARSKTAPRVGFIIKSATREARLAEAEDGALTKAIYAGK